MFNIHQFTKISAVVFLATSIAFTSCKKKDSEVIIDTEIAQQESMASVYSDDAENMASEAYETGEISGLTSADNERVLCAVVTRDYPNKTVTIDFGNTNCVGRDGRARRGKIIVRYDSTQFWAANCHHTFTFDNYFVNDNQVTGTKVVTVMQQGIAGNRSVESHLQILLANNGGTIVWNSERTRTMSAGSTTPLNILDDEYTVTGTTSGTAANGENFTFSVQTPLLRKILCPRHFVQGTVLRQRDNRADITVDFGNGDCDNIATVTKEGQTRTITLR